MNSDLLLQSAQRLKLHGLIAHWEEAKTSFNIEQLIHWEETVRSQRSLERRLKSLKEESFKSMADFDWHWPKKIDRLAIEDWLRLDFMKSATNLILCGPNGIGKSTIACNITHEAILKGYTACFITAADMLNELSAIDSDSALRRRIKHYTQPHLLVIDEVGYLSYGNRHADLLFEVISTRYEKKPTMITTNKPFTEWRDIFPNAACLISIIDRLVHHSEIVNIEGDSYRLKEAQEKNQQRSKLRKSKTKPGETI